MINASLNRLRRSLQPLLKPTDSSSNLQSYRGADQVRPGCHETFRSRLLRLRFSLYPCYRRTGARITYLAPDWKRVDIVLPLSWKTRGYFGVTFGGSIYGAVDPVLMIMFNRLLGPEIVVWDKRAAIEFLRPGTSTLATSFAIADDEIEVIRNELKNTRSTERTYSVEITDDAGKKCARIEKTLYFRRTSTVKETICNGRW